MRILFVDDEEDLRAAFQACFTSNVCHVDIAPEGRTALSMLDRWSYDVVFSDYNMPGMTGNQLLMQVARRHPRARRILISGSRVVTATAAEFFVAKPWSADDIKELLSELSAPKIVHPSIDFEDVTPVE